MTSDFNNDLVIEGIKILPKGFEVFPAGRLLDFALGYFKARIGIPVPLQNPMFIPSPDITKEKLKLISKQYRTLTNGKPFFAGKECTISGRTNLTFEDTSEEYINNLFREHSGNIGLCLGFDDIICIDFDNIDKYKDFYENHKDIIDNTPCEKTGNGIHILLRVEEEKWNTNKAIYFKGERVGELRGKNGYIALSPSVHYSGKQYNWIHSPFEMDILTIPSLDIMGLSYKDEYSVSHPKTFSTSTNPQVSLSVESSEEQSKYDDILLPKKYFFITQGSFEGYSSRSEAEMALVSYCITQDYTKDQIKHLMDTRCISTTKYKEECRKNSKYFDSTHNNACESLESSRTAKISHLDNLCKSVMLGVWDGITGITDQKLLIALLNISRRCLKLKNIHVSQRQLVEEAGLGGRKTVKKSLERLQQKNYIRYRVDFNKEINAKITTININSEEITRIDHSFIRGNVREWDTLDSIESISNDLYRHKGIGSIGFRIIQFIKKIETFTTRLIADETGLKVATVRRKIKKLLMLGLIKNVHNRVYSFNHEHSGLENAEIELGVHGRGRRNRQYHKIERNSWDKFKESSHPP